MSICLQLENGGEIICKDAAEVREQVLQAHAAGDAVNSVFDCDEHGDPVKGEKDYGCEWDVRIVELGLTRHTLQTVQLPCYGILVNFASDGKGAIVSDLKEEDTEENREYNAAIDGIESLILAHAIAGIDITAPAYVEGIETAVEAASNN
jgi:hypothetical protein